MRSGTVVILTRPLEQARGIAGKIEAAGGRAVHFPALEINTHTPTADALAALNCADMAIFISANAVEYGLSATNGKLPPQLALAVIGQVTAQALVQYGFQPAIVPEAGADSEALLATTALQDVAGKQIVIFRGVGGRETLRTALCQRGAKVAYIECYTRRAPDVAPSQVAELLKRDDVAAIQVLSRETLENFCHIIGRQGHQHFNRTALFVPHATVLEAARILGFGDVSVAGFGDDGLLRALEQRFPSGRSA